MPLEISTHQFGPEAPACRRSRQRWHVRPRILSNRRPNTNDQSPWVDKAWLKLWDHEVG